MDNILNLVEDKFGKIPFSHKGIKITKELIIETINILNSSPNRQMFQMARKNSMKNTPEGLDKELKKKLNVDTKMSDAISDVLEQVEVVKVFKSENPRTRRMVNTTKLVFNLN